MNFFQLRLSINRTSLLRLNESQAVSPHQGLLTLSGTINIYEMGWRLASRAICPAIANRGLSSSYLRTGGNSQIGETSLFSAADRAKSTDYSSKDNPRTLPANFGG
ncbi:hypothetical protein TNCV_3277501 [Trichonephila clavipes]|nr:hypothetical protein TNCV_3277501 [Trichonephila clavipes]